MSKSQEVEFKFRVANREALEAVAKAAGGTLASPVHQENHFYDTAQRTLDQAKYVLRLRQEGADYFLTAKGPPVSAEEGVLTAKSETEREVSPELVAAIREGRQSPLEALAGLKLDVAEAPLLEQLRSRVQGASLIRIGSFSNDRKRIETQLQVGGKSTSVTLEFDATVFPGNVTHYEIEVEVPEGVNAQALETALKGLLAAAKVEGSSGPSKAKRFFAALNGKAI